MKATAEWNEAELLFGLAQYLLRLSKNLYLMTNFSDGGIIPRVSSLWQVSGYLGGADYHSLDTQRIKVP